MSVSWIEHRGKKLLYIDYRETTDEGSMLTVLREAMSTIRNSSDKIRILTDFRNTTIPSNFMTEVKKEGKGSKEKTERHAILGVSGMKKVLLKAYVVFTGEKIKPCDSAEEAKDYLAA